jgi:hypothetical protein
MAKGGEGKGKYAIAELLKALRQQLKFSEGI